MHGVVQSQCSVGRKSYEIRGMQSPFEEKALPVALFIPASSSNGKRFTHTICYGVITSIEANIGMRESG